LVPTEPAEHVANHSRRRLLVVQGGVGDHADQRALEGAHAAVDTLRDFGQHLVRDRNAVDPRPLGEDGAPHVCRRRIQAGHEPGAEALLQAPLEVRELLGATVRRDHELAPGAEQRVERVEELLARLRPAGQELDVVDEHHVRAAELVLEVAGAPRADGVDELRRELLARGVANAEPGAVALDEVADRVEQVRLAESGRTV
jgi:hypothetical protein